MLDRDIVLPASVTDRRAFLARASALTLAIPGLGAALLGCGAPGEQGTPRAAGNTTAANPASTAVPATGVHNSDSRADSALLHGRAPESTSATAASTQGAHATVYHRFDPVLPPPPANGKVKLHWHAREAPVRIADDTVVAAWTFEGDTPGPVVHCRVGDTVEFTLTNDVDTPHSMDFHAAQLDPATAFRSVAKGQSVTFTYKPKYAGAFMYHCGTAPVLMHIGSGMHGALIVSPREPLPPAKEFVLVQEEYYLGAAVGGVRPHDYAKMLTTMPDFVTFNGRPDQYVKEPLRAKVGDRVRFWVVDAGPTHPCHFHVVGEQFDTVYLGAPPGNAVHGVQTWIVAAGGGNVFELLCDVPGHFPFVNHGFGHGQKGAIGILSVEA
ncbi:MAG: multicopper oxidase domain-containing protein [bacterium]